MTGRIPIGVDLRIRTGNFYRTDVEAAARAETAADSRAAAVAGSPYGAAAVNLNAAARTVAAAADPRARRQRITVCARYG